MSEEAEFPAPWRAAQKAREAIIVPGEVFVLAELHAMKLDGVLQPIVGDAFRCTASAESAPMRAAALHHHVPASLATRAALAQLSAAWVYGCAPPPTRLALLQSHGGKSASLPPFSWCTLREVNLELGEVQRLGGALITTPLRTALDVARTVPVPLARAVLLAMSASEDLQCSLTRMRLALQAATHVPGKLQGQDLLDSMIAEGAARYARRWLPVDR